MGTGDSEATPFLATPELDLDVMRFVSDAIDDRMAKDPIVGRMRRMPLPEGVRGVSVEVDAVSLESPSVPLSHSDRVMTSDLVDGNFEELHRIVYEMADSFLEQYLPSFFEHLDAAVESVGNSVDLSGEQLTWDHLIDAFEMVSWGVDDHGFVRPPQMHAGHDVRAKIEALPGMTPAQQERFVDVWVSKQEGHVSLRRSRRLRDEPDGA